MTEAAFFFQQIEPLDGQVTIHRPIADYKDPDNQDNADNSITVDSYKVRENATCGIVGGTQPKKAYFSCTYDENPYVLGAVIGTVQNVRFIGKLVVLGLWCGNCKADVKIGVTTIEKEDYKEGDLLMVFGEANFSEYNNKLTAVFTFPAITKVSASESVKGSKNSKLPATTKTRMSWMKPNQAGAESQQTVEHFDDEIPF
jgi:hypothetical protein